MNMTTVEKAIEALRNLLASFESAMKDARETLAAYEAERAAPAEQVARFSERLGRPVMEFGARMLKDGEPLFVTPAAPAACDGGTCGLGGYCDKCPKRAAAGHAPQPLTEAQIDGLILKYDTTRQAIRAAERLLGIGAAKGDGA